MTQKVKVRIKIAVIVIVIVVGLGYLLNKYNWYNTYLEDISGIWIAEDQSFAMTYAENGEIYAELKLDGRVINLRGAAFNGGYYEFYAQDNINRVVFNGTRSYFKNEDPDRLKLTVDPPSIFSETAWTHIVLHRFDYDSIITDYSHFQTFQK